jgi:hypothetical protein
MIVLMASHGLLMLCLSMKTRTYPLLLLCLFNMMALKGFFPLNLSQVAK